MTKERNNGHLLPGMGELKKPDEVKATEYISKLHNENFVDVNRNYLENYINSDLSIALSHIRKAYITYVLQGSWSEKKFDRVLLEIIDKCWLLIPTTFMRVGAMFDKGEIKEILKNETLSQDEIEDMLEGLF